MTSPSMAQNVAFGDAVLFPMVGRWYKADEMQARLEYSAALDVMRETDWKLRYAVISIGTYGRAKQDRMGRLTWEV